MGILIDYQEAKNKLTVSDLIESEGSSLEDAVAAFAFSQLPKRDRVALILAGIFGGEAESYLEKADEIVCYAANDFSVPYKAPVSVSEVTMGDVLR